MKIYNKGTTLCNIGYKIRECLIFTDDRYIDSDDAKEKIIKARALLDQLERKLNKEGEKCKKEQTEVA